MAQRQILNGFRVGHGGDLGVIDEVGETVAADDEEVAPLNLEPQQVDQHFFLESDRSGR